MISTSALYPGFVVHERMRPRHHRLRYEVFALLLDLDELPVLDRRLHGFAYNRPAIVSFYDRDHGAADGSPLRPWVEARMEEANVPPDGGPIRVLCYPRIFGHVFNPLTVYFCYRRSGSIAAILYEVCNTYGERHTYVIAVPEGSGRVIRQACDKAMYVSPFIAMGSRYRFRILPPEETVRIVIRQEDAGGLLLAAAFAGTREALTARSLARSLARFPMMIVKVIFGIHWEALRMWIKGFPVFSHHAAPAPVQSSVGHADADASWRANSKVEPT
jgi:DUF1365 family protein